MYRYLVLSISLVFSINVWADSDYFPLPQRWDFTLNTSNVYRGAFSVDGMIPVFGDETGHFYADVQATGGTNAGTAGSSARLKVATSTLQAVSSLGLGYRWMQGDFGAFGSYVFGEYFYNPGIDFFVVSPGLEFLSYNWDVHINGYFPVGHQSWIDTDWASHFGMSNPQFSGHTMIEDQLMRYLSPSHGGDFKFNVRMTNDWRASLGGYYFSSKDEFSATPSIKGVATGLTYWINNYCNLTLNYSYDNFYHNLIAVGVGFRVGGTSNPLDDVELLAQRMVDPVERHVFSLGRGVVLPLQAQFKKVGRGVSQDNIFFFNQSVSDTTPVTQMEQCTYEHPCGPQQFNQDTVDAIDKFRDQAQLYFNGGTYFAEGSGPGNRLHLYPNQTISSRSADYRFPSDLTQRTVFQGGFALEEGDVLTHVVLIPDEKVITAISTSDDAQAITIDQSQIGDPSHPFLTGVDVSSQLNIDHSTIYALVAGMTLHGHANVTANALQIQVFGNPDPASATFGITLQDGATLSLNDSHLNVNGGNAIGIAAAAQSSLTIERSTLNVQGGLDKKSTDIAINNATLVLNDSNLAISGGNVAGIAAEGQSNVTIARSHVAVQGNDSVSGLYFSGPMVVSITDSDISVLLQNQRSSNPVFGIYLSNGVRLSLDHDVISVTADGSSHERYLTGLSFTRQDNVSIDHSVFKLDSPNGIEIPIDAPFAKSWKISNTVCYNNGKEVKCI
jgi:hypothetical protein